MNPFGEHIPRRRRRFGNPARSAVVGAIVGLTLAACGGGVYVATAENGAEALRHETNVANNSLARIAKKEPIPVLYDSSDAHNQRLFLTEESDPNKIHYLELVGLNGAPYAHFTIKGQVSSMATSQTNFTQVVCPIDDDSSGVGCGTTGQAEANGVYQGADDGHFAFTTSNAEIEWDGNFLVSDQPFTIKAPVQLSLDESVAPSPTDLSHVAGGELPNGRTK